MVLNPMSQCQISLCRQEYCNASGAKRVGPSTTLKCGRPAGRRALADENHRRKKAPMDEALSRAPCLDSPVEATVRFEPTHRGFADPCLTTWLRRRYFFRSVLFSCLIQSGLYLTLLPFAILENWQLDLPAGTGALMNFAQFGGQVARIVIRRDDDARMTHQLANLG